MFRYIVTLFDTFHQWYDQGEVFAKDYNDAVMKANQDYATKRIRVVSVHRN